MTRSEIKAEVERTLKDLGFTSNQYRWSGCEIAIVLGGEFVTMRFPSGISKRLLAFEMGRLHGWRDILGTSRDWGSTGAPRQPTR
jgi:hypothetical protein